MARRSPFRAAIGAALWMLGCSPATPPAPAEVRPTMVFPMLVIWPGHSLVVWRDAEQYATLHTNILNDPSRPTPTLVDGTGAMFEMTGVHSTKGSMWLMVNPVAISPIAFTLTRRAGGVAEVRELVAGCRWLPGGDASRDRVKTADSVAAIVVALGDVPTTLPSADEVTPSTAPR